MALDFPSTPTNGQVYTDVTTGNRYVYVSAYNYWSYQAANIVGGAANTQVLFSDSGASNGTAGFTYNKTTNVVFIANNLVVGANVIHNTSAFSITGNTTTAPTVTLTGTGLTAGNTTITGAPQIIIANSAGNTTINTTSVLVGANVIHNTSAFSITGNSTTAPTTTLTGTGLTTGNTTSTGAPQVVVANTTGTTTINAGTVSTTTITGNLTGNVVATTATMGSTIVANTTGLYVNSTTQDLYINSAAGIWANGSFGAAGQALYSNGSAVYWGAVSVVGGANTQIQYNNSGTLTGSAAFTFINTTNTVTLDATAEILVGNTTVNAYINSVSVGSMVGFQNPTTLGFNYTTPASYNTMVAGPYTINAGVTLTVTAGTKFTIV